MILVHIIIYYYILIRGGARLHTEGLHNLYPSPSIIKNDQVKEDEICRTCSTNGGRRMHIEYWWESQNERDHWGDQDVGGWTILKWILER
jgi:hypothetical protein